MRWLDRTRGRSDTNFEVNLPARTNWLDPDEPPQIGEDDSATPFALHLEPMRDGWVRVRVEGELALNSSSTLERAVEAELMANSHVLLDLSGIDFIDSAGLRAMTALVRIAKATGRKLRLSADLPAARPAADGDRRPAAVRPDRGRRSLGRELRFAAGSAARVDPGSAEPPVASIARHLRT